MNWFFPNLNSLDQYTSPRNRSARQLFECSRDNLSIDHAPVHYINAVKLKFNSAALRTLYRRFPPSQDTDCNNSGKTHFSKPVLTNKIAVSSLYSGANTTPKSSIHFSVSEADHHKCFIVVYQTAPCAGLLTLHRANNVISVNFNQQPVLYVLLCIKF